MFPNSLSPKLLFYLNFLIGKKKKKNLNKKINVLLAENLQVKHALGCSNAKPQS
jgi:hypothetical protein